MAWAGQGLQGGPRGGQAPPLVVVSGPLVWVGVQGRDQRPIMGGGPRGSPHYKQNPVKRTRPRGQRLFPGGKSTIAVEDITVGGTRVPSVFRGHKSTLPAK